MNIASNARMTAVFGVAVLAIIMALAVAAFSAQQEDTNDAAQQLAAAQMRAAQAQSVARMLRILKLEAKTAPGLVAADSASLAEARLEGDMKALVEAQGGELRSAELQDVKASGHLEAIRVRYDLSVPAARLAAFIYAVESHTPFLIVDHVEMSGPMSWQSPAPPPDKASRIDLQWTLLSYRWRPA
ncbi:MAG: hypothetical protein KGJ78_07270 [Alphaproteobacteria bacterium]|nr:hypothetical protein [Alphaproteobacteria bacterium]